MCITSRNFREKRQLLVSRYWKHFTYKQMRGKSASTLLYLSSDDFSGQEVFHIRRGRTSPILLP